MHIVQCTKTSLTTRLDGRECHIHHTLNAKLFAPKPKKNRVRQLSGWLPKVKVSFVCQDMATGISRLTSDDLAADLLDIPFIRCVSPILEENQRCSIGLNGCLPYSSCFYHLVTFSFPHFAHCFPSQYCYGFPRLVLVCESIHRTM